MAGIVFGGIAACRRTTHCLGLLRSSYRPLGVCSYRRRRYTSSSKSGESAGKEGPGSLNQEVGEGNNAEKSTLGLGTAAAPPEPPKVPGERRPELPYEVRPEILPLQDQPNRSQPSPTEVKPPNPQTIVCSSDNIGSSGSNDDMVGKVVEFGSSVTTTENKDNDLKSVPSQSTNSSFTKSKDETKLNNLSSIESELKALAASVSDFGVDPFQKDCPLIKAELKSTDSTSKEPTGEQNLLGLSKSINETPQKTSPNIHESKDKITAKDSSKTQLSNTQSFSSKPENSKSNSASKTDASGSLDLKVISSPLQKAQTATENSKTSTANIEALKQSPNPNAKYAQTPIGESSSFNMPAEGKISGITVNSKALGDRSEEFRKMLDKSHERRFNYIDKPNENEENRDRILKWVEHFKSVSKKELSTSESKIINANAAPIEFKSEKPYFIETLIKKENTWVPKDKTSPNTSSLTSSHDSTSKKTSKVNSQLELPLKIVAKHKAPTEFRQIFKPIPPSELQSSKKDTKSDSKTKTTKPKEFISSKPLSSLKPADSQIPNPFIGLDNAKRIGVTYNEPKSQSTEEIVAMFKDEHDGDQYKNEEGKVNELFETLEKFNDNPGAWWTLQELSSATKSSQAEVLAMLSSPSDKKGQIGIHEKFQLDTTGSANKSDDHFTKLGHLDSAIREEDETDKKDKPKEDYFVKLSNLDSTIREETSDKPNKKVESAKSEKNEEKPVELKSFDLAQKVSSFVKSADKSGIKNDATQKPQRFKKSESSSSDSKVKTTSELTPSDLYDPVSPEVSSVSLSETGKTELKEEAEESSPSLEAPEVKPKKEQAKVKAPTSMDETRTKVDEKPAVEVNQPSKEKPQLDDGELALKLRDKATGEIPVIPAVPVKPPVEKSFIQHFFDKILGRGKSGEGKRQMSSFTGQRRMSTFSMNILPYGIATGFPNRDSMLVKKELDMFAKKNDDTEIKGGSPECSSPKKSPRELLREKQQTRNIKILGGSEECAKKMKRLKKLAKEKDDDDCDSRCFSNHLSRFLSQLSFSIIPDAANTSRKNK